MQVWYGPYALPANGVDVATAIRATLGLRGNPLTYIHTVTLTGLLEGDTQAECSAAEAAFRLAFSKPDLDLVLKQDSGAATPTYLRASTSLVGVQLLAMSFPNTYGGAEYATARGFSLTVQAEYAAQQADQLVSWDETITVVGNGGPRVVIREVVQGDPVEQEVSERTAVTATQTGQAVGLFSQPTPPPPFFPRDRLVSQTDTLTKSTPQTPGRRPMRWPVSWQYQFQSPTPLAFGRLRLPPARI